MISEELVALATTAILARVSERSPPVALVGLEEQYKYGPNILDIPPTMYAKQEESILLTCL